MQVQVQPKALKLKVLVKLTIYETSLIYEVRKKAF